MSHVEAFTPVSYKLIRQMFSIHLDIVIPYEDILSANHETSTVLVRDSSNVSALPIPENCKVKISTFC